MADMNERLLPQRLSEEPVYESSWLTVKRVRVSMPDGTEAEFELRDEPDVAICLPVTDAGDVVMVEEYRHGPQKYLFEIPGGTIDFGESPLAAARREVLEESGYDGIPVLLATTWIGAYSRARKHICIAHSAQPAAPPLRAPNELLEVRQLTPRDFAKVVEGGELTDLDAGLCCLRALRMLGSW